MAEIALDEARFGEPAFAEVRVDEPQRDEDELAFEVRPSSLLSLLRFGSAALPIGAFAYSQGLERAVSAGVVHDARSTERWVLGVLKHAVLTSDVPLLLRLYAALQTGDQQTAARLSCELYATRPTRELREEELQLGRSLLRLLSGLGLVRTRALEHPRRVTLAYAFALAGVELKLGTRGIALTYIFAWAEAQVTAATRLVPLGQTEAQEALSHVLEAVPEGLQRALIIKDHDLTSSSFGQVLFSMQHEREYSRLFRS